MRGLNVMPPNRSVAFGGNVADMSRALIVLLLIACSKPKQETVKPEPPKQLPSVFSIELEGEKRDFAFGNGFLRDGQLQIYLTTKATPCPNMFATGAYTLWFHVPAGPDARFFAGTAIDTQIVWRESLSAAHTLDPPTSVKIAVVEAGRARGHLEIAGNKGDFDVRICNRDEKIAKAPPREIGERVEGTVGGKPFEHQRAFLHEGGASIVLTDDKKATCADFKPAGCPALPASPHVGIMIELRAYDHHITDSPRPARGAYWIGEKTPTGLHAVETRVPAGLALKLTHDDGKRVKGELRGYFGNDLDVAGAFDAEVCPKTCL